MMKLVIRHEVLGAASFAQHDVETIIQRAVEANALDWKVPPYHLPSKALQGRIHWEARR